MTPVSASTSTAPRPVPRLMHRGDLVRAGYSDDELATLVRTGRLERAAHGVYARPTTAEDPRDAAVDRYLSRSIAHAAQTPSSVISHTSGATVHDLTLARVPLSTVHLTRPGVGGGRRSPGLWIHTASMADDDLVTVHGLRVTSVARTVVDIARTESLRNAVAIADDAVHRELVTTEAIVAAMARAAHARGMRAARRALALVDGRSESVGESFARLALRAAGLPTPQLQINVYSAGGAFLARCDFGYDDVAVLIEFDGATKYGRLRRPGETVEQAVLREKAREDALREAGFIVVRLVWSELADPARLRTRIIEAIRLGRRAVAAGIVTGRCVPLAPRLVAA